eukprot:g6836.t1
MVVSARANHKSGPCEQIPYLPLDLYAHGYRFDSSKQQMATIARYVTAQEWQELAQATNKSIQKHHICNSCCAMFPMYVTLGVCFCPLIYVAMKTKGRIHKDLAELPVVRQMGSRGISLRWVPKSDFDAGGLVLTMAAQTPEVIQPQMTGGAQTVPVVQGTFVPAAQVAPTQSNMNR